MLRAALLLTVVSLLAGITLGFDELQLAERAPSSTTLSNGTSGVILYGKVGDMTWGASGILTATCPPGAPIFASCYSMYLTSNASAMLDSKNPDSPRQRNEWRFPTLSVGSSFSYSWKQYLAPTGTSTKFFHLMQVFGVPEGNPVVALDVLNKGLKIVDNACGSTCPTTTVASYVGIYTTHYISGRTGPSGTLNYTVVGPTGAKIISYSRTGSLCTGDAYIKFGTYRASFDGMTAVNSTVGEWRTY